MERISLRQTDDWLHTDIAGMLVCWFSAFVSVMIVFHISIRINDLCWVSGFLLISISSLC